MFPDLTRDDVFRLETRRLWLRWPRLADVQAIVRLAGEKAVAEMTARIPHPYSPEDAERFVFHARLSNANGEGLQLAITPKGKPNAPIGMVGIGPHPEDGRPSLGYWLGIPYWGQGYATEAARALILYAFASERFDFLTVGHFKENPASARVIAKLGFEASGEVLRDCAARNAKSRCLTYRLTRERALLPPDLVASPLSPAERGLG
jgi:RimJ/RimL family protein N-acetyltransferase